jgi:hypothetical protein
MNRGTKIVVAGLSALALMGPVASVAPASAAASQGHHYVYARYWHHGYYGHRYYGGGYGWRRHYGYGPGPVIGGLFGALVGGALAAPYYGPPAYYYGPRYYYGPGPYYYGW